MAALLIVTGNVFADDLIKNGDFSAVAANGTPENWRCSLSSSNQCTVEDGVLSFQVNDSSALALVLQDKLPLEPGKKYIMMSEVKGDEGSEYYFYLEFRRMVNGKPGPMASINTAKFKAPADFTLNQVAFTLPEDAVNCYIVLRACSGNVSFRNVKLVDFASSAPADSLVKNGYFDEIAGKSPVNWEMRGSGWKVLPATNGNVLSMPNGALALQRNLPFEEGQRYTVTCQVRSNDAENFFMFYTEWKLNGDLRSAIYPGHKATSEWQDCKLNIVFPAGASNGYIVLASRGGTIEFRNVEILKAE